MCDDAYRVMLLEVGGVESSKDLDEAGFNRVMARFEALGFKSRRSSKSFGHRRGMATPKQIQYVRDMWKQYTGSDNETSLNRWLEHHFHISNIRFVNNEIVAKVLPALKAMTRRNMQRSSSPEIDS